MKNLLFILFAIIVLTSCKATLYQVSYGQLNQTQVILSDTNFNVLGSFTGIATEKKYVKNVKGKEGLISQAKANLLKSAKSKGIEMTGSRTLINVSVDLVETRKRATATLTAEIIEFK